MNDYLTNFLVVRLILITLCDDVPWPESFVQFLYTFVMINNTISILKDFLLIANLLDGVFRQASRHSCRLSHGEIHAFCESL